MDFISFKQIENIQRVIKVTRKKLEAMNEEFGKHQHPPSIYVQVSFFYCFFFTFCFLYKNTNLRETE